MNRYHLNHNPRTDLSASLTRYERAVKTIEELYIIINDAYQLMKRDCDLDVYIVRLREGTFHLESSERGAAIFFMVDDNTVAPIGRMKVSLTLATIVTNTKEDLAKIIGKTIEDGHQHLSATRNREKSQSSFVSVVADERKPDTPANEMMRAVGIQTNEPL